MTKKPKLSKKPVTKKPAKPKKKVTKKKLKNRIAIILDRSSSMDVIRDEAIGAFNEQLKAIRESAKGMDTKVTLATFSNIADEPLINNQDVSKLKPLTRDSYVPSGCTAMYDAVGAQIQRFLATPEANDENTSFLMIIISDGQENSSHHYSQNQIAEKVRQLQMTRRWTFTYLGANQDLSKVSSNLGIYLGNTMAFQANSIGTQYASVQTANATGNFLRARSVEGQSSTTSFYQQPTTKSDKKS